MGIELFLVYALIGALVAVAAGALSGMRIGAEALGPELAAMMGGLFGPLAVVPAMVVGLGVVSLLRG